MKEVVGMCGVDDPKVTPHYYQKTHDEAQSAFKIYNNGFPFEMLELTSVKPSGEVDGPVQGPFTEDGVEPILNPTLELSRVTRSMKTKELSTLTGIVVEHQEPSEKQRFLCYKESTLMETGPRSKDKAAQNTPEEAERLNTARRNGARPTGEYLEDDYATD